MTSNDIENLLKLWGLRHNRDELGHLGYGKSHLAQLLVRPASESPDELLAIVGEAMDQLKEEDPETGAILIDRFLKKKGMAEIGQRHPTATGKPRDRNNVSRRIAQGVYWIKDYLASKSLVF